MKAQRSPLMKMVRLTGHGNVGALRMKMAEFMGCEEGGE